MRRALGLDGQPRAARPPARATEHQGTGQVRHHRHRFVGDGEVPVVVMSRAEPSPAPRQQDSSATALAEERAAKERAERSLAAVQTQVRDLQTKLAHVTLARDEALAALQHAQEELVAARAAAAPTETQVAGDPPVRRRRGRPPKSLNGQVPAKPRTRSQQPVRWWVKGWREALPE